MLQQTITRPARSPEFAHIQPSAFPTRMPTDACVSRATSLEMPIHAPAAIDGQHSFAFAGNLWGCLRAAAPEGEAEMSEL